MNPFLVLFFLALVSFHNSRAQNWVPAPQPVPADSSRQTNITDTEASFPGGEGAWNQYLMKNLHPERIVDLVKFPRGKKKIKQIVIVKFIIARDGTLADVSAENYDQVDPYCAAEAIRVIKKSPNWIPAYQNGHKVNAYRRQPITFEFER